MAALFKGVLFQKQENGRPLFCKHPVFKIGLSKLEFCKFWSLKSWQCIKRYWKMILASVTNIEILYFLGQFNSMLLAYVWLWNLELWNLRTLRKYMQVMDYGVAQHQLKNANSKSSILHGRYVLWNWHQYSWVNPNIQILHTGCLIVKWVILNGSEG